MVGLSSQNQQERRFQEIFTLVPAQGSQGGCLGSADKEQSFNSNKNKHFPLNPVSFHQNQNKMTCFAFLATRDMNPLHPLTMGIKKLLQMSCGNAPPLQISSDCSNC